MSRREKYCVVFVLDVLEENVLWDGGLSRETTTSCVVETVFTSSREMRGDGERLRREGPSSVF